MVASAEHDVDVDLKVSQRDPGSLAAPLTDWLADRLGAGSEPEVTILSTDATNGMSSETVILDAVYGTGGQRRRHPLVARIAPRADEEPVFDHYDLRGQYEVMAAVAGGSEVPVPGVRWFEEDASVIGSPFFLMDRVEGRVPPDVMPYNFGDNWLYDAAPAEQRRLQDSTVDVIAAIHEVPVTEALAAHLARTAPGGDDLTRHLAATRAWYGYAAERASRSPVVEAGLDWLEANRPAEPGPSVLSWGDSRIGNVLYEGFEPVGVLDWEMMGVGPRELDVAWLVTAHRVFEHLAADLGLGGMPGFMRADDVVDRYERTSGVRLGDLGYYVNYALVQWSIVFIRTGTRQARFEGRELPADIDELIYVRSLVESIFTP